MADATSEVISLPPVGGRSDQAGPMRAVFKADGAETGVEARMAAIGAYLEGRGEVDEP